MSVMKGIKLCGECRNYDYKKHRCRIGCIDDSNAQASFYGDCPLPDVVPKSEYDAVVSALDNSTKEFLKLHDDYQEAKREVYKWMCRCREWHEVAAEKSKLVREIFEEIEEILKSSQTELIGKKFYYRVIVDKGISELKKKYTEERT